MNVNAFIFLTNVPNTSHNTRPEQQRDVLKIFYKHFNVTTAMYCKQNIYFIL